MAATLRSTRLWPSGKVPFVFSEGYPYQQSILDAMHEIEIHSRIRFCQRHNETNYVEIIKDMSDHNYANVGMQGGKQTANIKMGYHGLHELLHTIGLIHEHKRSDRDDFVTLDYSHIEHGMNNLDFTKETDSLNLTEYDPHSVLHQPTPIKGWGGYPPDQEIRTMYWKVDKGKDLGPTRWTELSPLDIVGINALYDTVPC